AARGEWARCGEQRNESNLMPTTALISAAVGAAGSIGASVIGANAQSNAANKAIAAQQQALQQGQAFATNELTNAQTTLHQHRSALVRPRTIRSPRHLRRHSLRAI